jgi:SAM-dependent methyltransferase
MVYEPSLWMGERAGLRVLRRDLLRRAKGRTVELGSGTGLNLPYYPEGLDELVLTEPADAMRARLEQKLSRSRYEARAVAAPAEKLPFEDGTVDTVVSTLVLCTVDAPEIAVQEIRRVLRPGGQFLFLEHVRSDSPRLASWQDRCVGAWRRLAEGCRCNRATVDLVRESGLELVELDTASWHFMPPIIRPLVTGVAVKGNAGVPNG